MTERNPDRRLAVVLPKMEGAAGEWLRGVRIPGFAVAMLFLIVAAIVVLAPTIRLLIEQQEDLAQLRAAVDSQQTEVDRLEEEVARWGDPAYLEAQARSRLFYVYPGEISYLVIDDGQTPMGVEQLPISVELQAAKVDWLAALTSSLFTAATTEATPAELEAPQIGAP